MASESLFIISNSQPRGKYEVRYSKAVEQLTGKDIKKTVEKIISIPVSNQILKFKNVVIGDTDVGSQHGLVNGDVIIVEQINQADPAVFTQPKAATAFATPPRVSAMGRPISPQMVPTGGPRPMPAQPTQLVPVTRSASPVTPTRTRVAPFAPGTALAQARPVIPPQAVVATPVRTSQQAFVSQGLPSTTSHPPSPRGSGYNQTALNSVSLMGDYIVSQMPTEYIQRTPRSLSPQRIQILPTPHQAVPIMPAASGILTHTVQPLVPNAAPGHMSQMAHIAQAPQMPQMAQIAQAPQTTHFPSQSQAVPFGIVSPQLQQSQSFTQGSIITVSGAPQMIPTPASPPAPPAPQMNIVLPPPRAVQHPTSPMQAVQSPPNPKVIQATFPTLPVPTFPEVTSFVSYLTDERPTVADFQTLLAQREHTIQLKMEHDALRQARDMDFLRTHKEFEELRMKSEMDVANLDREIRERTEEIERLANRQHRAMDNIYKLRQDRGVERSVEDQISRGLGQQMSVLTEAAERIRSEELEMLQRKLREQTDFQTILGSERMRLERERREKRTHAVEIERELQRRVEDLELKESLLEKEWFDIQNRRAALEVVLPPSLMDMSRQPLPPQLPPFL